jgi:hypothetical protein
LRHTRDRRNSELAGCRQLAESGIGRGRLIGDDDTLSIPEIDLSGTLPVRACDLGDVPHRHDEYLRLCGATERQNGRECQTTYCVHNASFVMTADYLVPRVPLLQRRAATLPAND